MEICYTWKVFTEKRYIPVIKNFVQTQSVFMTKENDWQLLPFFVSWLVLPCMVAVHFYGIFRIWEKLFENTCYNFIAIISVALLQPSRFNLHVPFRLSCQTPVFEMPLLNRNGKVTCDNCGTQSTKIRPIRHTENCPAGTLYCTY